MNNTTEGFMKIAIAEAQKGMNRRNRPFGSVIVKDGRVAARAHSTAFSSHDVTAHAELTAIRKLCNKAKTRDLKGYTIYATGEPCLMCSAAIAMANLSELVIAANYADMSERMHSGRMRPGKVTYKQIFGEYGLKIKVKKGVLRDEVIELYKRFVKRLS